MSLDAKQTYVITTDDGVMIRCHVEKVGTDDKYPEHIRRRWIFQRSNRGATVVHVGPPYYPLANERELRDLVAEWWDRYGFKDLR